MAFQLLSLLSMSSMVKLSASKCERVIPAPTYTPVGGSTVCARA
jgi:hypothetical protein